MAREESSGRGAGKGRGQAFGEHRDREEYETTSGYVTRVTRKAVVRGCSERVREAVSKAEAGKRIETGKREREGEKRKEKRSSDVCIYIYTHTMNDGRQVRCSAQREFHIVLSSARFRGDILRAHNLAAHLRAWIIVSLCKRTNIRINIDMILECV